MAENVNTIESLLERVEDYGKTSFELVKLKALDKTSDVLSSFVPHSVVVCFIAAFLLFSNLGLAFWLGEIFGKIYYGFFVVSAFYGVTGLIMHFFMHKWMKRIVCNNIIKQVLN